jgi:hypothetical protein
VRRRGLELLDRGKHIAAALKKHLPRSYPDAVELLLRTLGPELSVGESRCGEDAGTWGFLAARVLHTVFCARAMQPHRTIPYTVGALIMFAMALPTLRATL